MNTNPKLTCNKCGNKLFNFSAEFNFDNKFIDPICSECLTPINKEEYIRQVQETMKNAATEFLQGSGFTIK